MDRIDFYKSIKYDTVRRTVFSHFCEGLMIITKQMDIRSNIKKYFDLAYNGEAVFVSRKQSKNVVIISENEYNDLSRANRLEAYAGTMISRSARPNAALSSDSIREDNLRKIRNIGNLKDNWNGNGASAFSKALIDRVMELVNTLPIQPEVFPTALNTIQFEYDNSRHDHMEIEIGDSDDAEIFIVTYFGKEIEESIPSTYESLAERIAQFYG